MMRLKIKTLVKLSVVSAILFAVVFTNTVKAEQLLTRSQALSQLSESAYQKINIDALNKFLDESQSEIIVEFKHDLSTNAITAETDRPKLLELRKAQYRNVKEKVIGDVGAKSIEYINDFNLLPMAFLRTSSLRSLVELLNDSEVTAIYENQAHTINLQESLEQIAQTTIASEGYVGTGTTVAILDTGVDYTLPAFGSCNEPGEQGCRVVDAFDTAPDDNQLDAHGHGTNVAGIAIGVAPGASVLAIDVFDGNSAFSADIIAAINQTIALQAIYNIVAMNLSLGIHGVSYATPCDSSWATVPFAQARSVGITPVVAAGNDGFIDGVELPACTPGAVCVGAVYDFNGTYSSSTCTDDQAAIDRVTCFSNSNDQLLTLLAPGSRITSAGITMSGTSQAAPHVSGAIAVMRADDVAPNDTLDGTIERLINTGVQIIDHRNNVQKSRIDLYMAVHDAIEEPLNVNYLTPIISLLLLD